jgi:purine-binding chemotaxis protein CheW
VSAPGGEDLLNVQPAAPDVVAEARWESLARAAAAGESQDEAVLRREFVTFRLGEDAYALPIERVREVVRLRPITPMPRVPSAVRGVISLRGEVVQVVDLRSRLGMEPAAASRTSRIIVLHGEDCAVAGLLVDSVRDVLRLTDEEIRPSGASEADVVVSLLTDGDKFVSQLDVDRVLDLDE